MKKVFISYRREDTQAIAGRLYDGLEVRLGTDSVFFDIDSIPLGTDFREHVTATLDGCGVLLVVIGSRWLQPAENGRRRIDDPDDLVRVEVEAALERRIPVVPVLIDRTPMPNAEQMPGALSSLAYRNAVRLDSGIDFRNHLARLVAGISPLLDGAKNAAIPATDLRTDGAIGIDAGAGADGALLHVSTGHPPSTPSEASTSPKPHELKMFEAADESATQPSALANPSPPQPLASTAPVTSPWLRVSVAAAATALVLLLVYVGLSYLLARAVQRVDDRMQLLSLPAPPIPTAQGPQPKLEDSLRPEIRAGRLAVVVVNNRIVVRVPSDAVFEKGSASIEARIQPVLVRVAEALRAQPGRVLVTAYTDNVQISTSHFPSNWHLSTERARAVGALLVKNGVGADRLTAEGRANSDPLTLSDTAEGRALNRRIEIALDKVPVQPAGNAPKGGS